MSPDSSVFNFGGLLKFRIISSAALIVVSAIHGCAYQAGTSYKLYPGPQRSQSDLTRLTFGTNVRSFEVNGLRVNRNDYASVDLEPGQYTVSSRNGLNWWPEVSSGRHVSGPVLTVNLRAGVEYLVDGAMTDWPSERANFLWIEDHDSGVILAGERP